MTDEHKNMKASPGLEIGLRPENGTYELCDKHYDASKTEAPEHCAVCSLQAKVEKLEANKKGYDEIIDMLESQLEAAEEARIISYDQGFADAKQQILSLIRESAMF